MPKVIGGFGQFDTGSTRFRLSRAAVRWYMPSLLADLTTPTYVGTIANMKARLIHRDRMTFDDGGILEMIIWEVPTPVEGSVHRYKYRLFYGYAGKRIVGYDNERPKGDHRHIGDAEEPYRFTTSENLIRDFIADVMSRRTS